MTKTRTDQELSFKHNVAEGISPNDDLSGLTIELCDERGKDPIANIANLVTAPLSGASSKKKRKIRKILLTLSADSDLDTENMR